MQSNDIDFLDLLNGQVQYVVPRWQRRYRWGRPDIERLVQDLLAVAAADEESAHYGGTLLTFLEPGPAGVVKTIRVVDGQQRLTTVSILLACIAGSRHSSAPIRLSLIPTAFGVMTDPFRYPARVKSSSPPSGSESALAPTLTRHTIAEEDAHGSNRVAQSKQTPEKPERFTPDSPGDRTLSMSSCK